jgi:CRISPR system Cascade subunit CasE
MFLSRVRLDTNKRKTQIAFESPNLFHGAVETSFSERQRRNLWRIDKLMGQYYILILSEDRPCLDGFIRQFGYKGETGEIKEYDALLNRLDIDQKWRFRLVANPTRTIKNDKGERKISAHVSEKYQLQWLTQKAEKHGFEINEAMVVSSDWKIFRKNGGASRVRLKEAVFEGSLTIKDLELFKSALIRGIGREKVYGMGMLTIVRGG